MPNEPKDPNANGLGAPRDRKNTPIISVGGPSGAADQLARLQRTLRRIVDVSGEAERLVRSSGFTPEARAFLGEIAEHFEDELPAISAGIGRTLRRIADLG